MPLLILPNELLLQTASYLPPRPLGRLILASRFLANLLTPLLHTFALAPVNNEPALIWASSRGYITLVAFLLKSPNINVNELSTRVSGHRTALHRAAGDWHTQIVALLLENGAYVNAKDRHGKTPFWYAVKQGSENIVRMLLAYGANMGAQSVEALILVCPGYGPLR